MRRGGRLMGNVWEPCKRRDGVCGFPVVNILS